jgi:hypothetical protein
MLISYKLFKRLITVNSYFKSFRSRLNWVPLSELRFGNRIPLRHPNFASGARGPFRFAQEDKFAKFNFFRIFRSEFCFAQADFLLSYSLFLKATFFPQHACSFLVPPASLTTVSIVRESRIWVPITAVMPRSKKGFG